MAAQKVKSDLATWKEEQEAGYLAEAWVAAFKFDEEKLQVQFKIDLYDTEDFEICRVKIPATYPKGTYTMFFNGEEETYTGNSVADVLDEVFGSLVGKRNEIHQEEPEGTDEATTPIATPSAIGMEPDPFGEREELTNRISKDLEELEKYNGYFGELEFPKHEDEVIVYAMLDPKKRLGINSLVAGAWGINLDKYITIALTFSKYYLDCAVMPTIKSFQSGDTSTREGASQKHIKYGVYWTVEQRVMNTFIKPNWPIYEKYAPIHKETGKNYLVAALEVVEETIKNASGHCIMCWDKMPIVGIKPTVCEKTVCVYSHEQYGLGVDLESAILQNGDIVDMLISMAYAACNAQSSRFNPFNPFPTALGLKLKNKETEAVEEYSFLNASGERDNEKCRKVLELVPPVSKLREWVEASQLKEKCDKLHPLLYMMLRWILASNRCHLKKLKPHEQITEMKTEHQYALLSSTVEKERRFQAEKEKYGSMLAFHGSALCNWHSIMRIGLKNMSGTEGQVNGAVYGSGIYLATNSATSFGYLRYQSSWPNSQFGSANLGCIAVCEIINNNYTANPYYVIPNEDHVCTRYFFIYNNNNSNSADVIAQNIKLPKVDQY